MLFELSDLIVDTAAYALSATGSVFAGGMPDLPDWGALAGGALAAATTAVAAVATGGLSLAGPLSTAVGDAAGDAAAAAYDGRPGDNVTEYIPGVSPIPAVGDIIYVPGMGASKVERVEVAPDLGSVLVTTQLGATGYHTDPWTEVTTRDPITGEEHTDLSFPGEE